MAITTCMFPMFYMHGDGVSTTFVISVKTTPIMFDRFTVVNFPKNVDVAAIVSARDHLNNDMTPQVSCTVSGSAITLTFTTPFVDVWTVQMRFEFIGG